METTISSSLQENLLILLSFYTPEAKLIRNTVDASLFEGVYHNISNRIYSYIDKYGEAPKDHLSDIFFDILEGKDNNKKGIYEDTLNYLYTQKDGINKEYAMSKLATFVRQQKIKGAILDVIDLVNSNDEEDIDKAEIILNAALKDKLKLFDPGTLFSDTTKTLRFLEANEDSYQTGIKDLDKRNLGPARKELIVFVALPNRGKTWWMIHLSKMAILHRKKVLHISLEMSEKRMAQRYYQAMFGLAKRRESVNITEFKLDALDRLIELEPTSITPRLHMDDPKIEEKLREKSDQWGAKFDNLIIKEFPTGSLTINGLKAYLDSLETAQNFIPDLLVIDYPDLMHIDGNNYRTDLGRIYKELRGIAVERNIAIAAASQSNREGAKAGTVTDVNIAEDFSKMATADTVITYSQTEQEKLLGLARLFVAKGRNDEARFHIMISQNYAMGQFVLDSSMMVSKYFRELDKLAGAVAD